MRDNPNDGCQVDYGLAESLTDISNGISKELLFPKHLNQDVGMEIYSLKKNETSISTHNDNNRKMNIAGQV